MRSPTRPYRAVRAAVGSLMVLGFFGAWMHGQLVGQPLGTVYEIVLVALVLAGAYAVLGQRTVEAAVDDAQELAGSGDGSDEQGGDDPDGGQA